MAPAKKKKKEWRIFHGGVLSDGEKGSFVLRKPTCCRWNAFKRTEPHRSRAKLKRTEPDLVRRRFGLRQNKDMEKYKDLFCLLAL